MSFDILKEPSTSGKCGGVQSKFRTDVAKRGEAMNSTPRH